jgi:hypothetical protein
VREKGNGENVKLFTPRQQLKTEKNGSQLVEKLTGTS